MYYTCKNKTASLSTCTAWLNSDTCLVEKTRLEKRNSLYFFDKKKKINGKITKRVFKLSLSKSEAIYNTLYRKNHIEVLHAEGLYL